MRLRKLIAEAGRWPRFPASPKAFAGCWRIVEMDNWDSDFLDLVEEAHLTLATIQASFANAAEFFNSLLVANLIFRCRSRPG